MIRDEILLRTLKTALARGGEFADIFIEHKQTTAIQVENGVIEKVTAGSVAGVGIRLICKGKTAYAYSNDFSEAGLLQSAETVSKAASGAVADTVINLKKRYPDATFPAGIIPGTVPMSTKVNLVMEGDRVARKYDGRIKQASVIYRDSLQKVKMATSDGFIAEDERVYTLGMVHVVAAEGDIIQTGYETVGGLAGYELLEETPVSAIALIASQRAIMMLGARKAPGGRMPVVISADAGGTMIHEAIGHGLEADLVQQGLSVYAGKKGLLVASPAITVVDDATIPFKRGSFSFDDEGTPSRKNTLVGKGILMGFMYDRNTAMRDGTVSTGNGRRESYESKPIPRMTNTFIEPGDMHPDEVIRSVDSGLLVKKMGGGQVNTVTGDFVFEVQEGYLIEKGAAGEPVRGATLTGNGLTVLQSIDMVASDMGFSIGTCGKDGQGVPVSDGMPTLRIPELVVGGEIKQV